MRSLLCALLLACAPLVAAQTYPAKPLRLIVGYSAGGGADALARLVASEMVARLNTVLRAALSSLDLLSSFTAQGAFADWSTPQALGARMTEEARRWAQIAKDAGIKAE